MQSNELLKCVARATESMSTQIDLLGKAKDPMDIETFSSALNSYAKAAAKLSTKLLQECKSGMVEVAR